MLRQDAGYAWRLARRSPVFTAAIVLTLGLGIGANTAVFTVVDAVLLKPLSYPRSDRLVAIFLTEASRNEARNPTSPANYLDWKTRSRTVGGMTAAYPWQPTLTGSGRPVAVHGLRASGSLFDLLGVAPALGRGFSEDDDRRDPHVVVLGHALWQRTFGGDAGVIGRRITLDGDRYTVVGVMPAGFRFPPFWATDAEFWAPIAFTPEQAADRDSRFLRVFGRFRPGADRAAAQAELSAIGAALAAEHPADNAGTGVNVEALYEPAVSSGRPVILIFAAAAALALLVVLVNVSSLLLSRASARRRELALRAALGAGRGRLLRQLLTESVLLGGAGGVAGVLFALWGVRALVAAAPAGLPRLDEIAPDPRVFAAALVVSLATGLIVGLAPAWRAVRADLRGALEQGARGGTDGRSPRRHDALVVAEVALAVTLAVGAGLLARSFVSLLTLDPGFASGHRLTAVVGFAGTPFAEPAQQPALFRELVTRVEALPGVRRAALVDSPSDRRGHLAMGPDNRRRPRARTGARAVGGAPGGHARLLRDDGHPPRARAELHARRPRRGPRERDVRAAVPDGPGSRRPPAQAGERPVGIARGSRSPACTATRASGGCPPTCSRRSDPPYAINPVAWWGRTTLVVETEVDPRTLAAGVRAAAWSIDPTLPVDPVRTMGTSSRGRSPGRASRRRSSVCSRRSRWSLPSWACRRAGVCRVAADEGDGRARRARRAAGAGLPARARARAGAGRDGPGPRPRRRRRRRAVRIEPAVRRHGGRSDHLRGRRRGRPARGGGGVRDPRVARLDHRSDRRAARRLTDVNRQSACPAEARLIGRATAGNRQCSTRRSAGTSRS